ncbi:hypothetical protein RRF57_003808 [Xylaria bambusicola]|uniref:Uncharacterized protein n=1 Tax=Xylaria bambusicola TaxID=326684 RepID=A0AAN7UFN5_9PEZI
MSSVKPKSSRNSADIMAPVRMKGRRRPNLDVDLSAMVPTIGCTTSPDNGPAIHTSDVLLFVNPRERRYGVQYVCSTPHTNLGK